MRLTLDHLIIRSAEPQTTLSELSAKAGAPILAEVEEVAGLASGIARAGALDIEVLRIGKTPPPREQGYGLGFTADAPLGEATPRSARSASPRRAPSARPPAAARGAPCTSTACSPIRSRCR